MDRLRCKSVLTMCFFHLFLRALRWRRLLPDDTQTTYIRQLSREPRRTKAGHGYTTLNLSNRCTVSKLCYAVNGIFSYFIIFSCLHTSQHLTSSAHPHSSPQPPISAKSP